MPWNWKRFWDLAKRFEKSADEAEQRTAISRAYYFAHHIACEYCWDVYKKGFKRDGSRHQDLIDYLDENKGEDSVIASRLSRIKAERNKADYDTIFVREPIGVCLTKTFFETSQIESTLEKLRNNSK